MRLNPEILIRVIFAITANSISIYAVCNIYSADSCNLRIQAEINEVSCNGFHDGSIDLSVSGKEAYSFLWNTGSINEDLYHIPAGIYTVKIKAGDCIVTRSFKVKEPPLLQLAIDNLKSVTCPGGADGEISSHAQGGTPPYIFTLMDSLTNPEGVFRNLYAGVYSISVKDFQKCTTGLILEVKEAEIYTVIPGGNYTVFSGEEFILDAGEGFLEYKWSNGENSQMISVLLNALEAVQQNFMVEVKDKNGCWYTSGEITLNILPQTVSDYNDTISNENILFDEDISPEDEVSTQEGLEPD
ncbi:MAG: SprB repeat-containing protein [Bacteroidales bacterium]|nr:SprB repeat-containing protein [Bacteroidales bacterium]